MTRPHNEAAGWSSGSRRDCPRVVCAVAAAVRRPCGELPQSWLGRRDVPPWEFPPVGLASASASASSRCAALFAAFGAVFRRMVRARAPRTGGGTLRRAAGPAPTTRKRGTQPRRGSAPRTPSGNRSAHKRHRRTARPRAPDDEHRTDHPRPHNDHAPTRATSHPKGHHGHEKRTGPTPAPKRPPRQARGCEGHGGGAGSAWA